MIQVTPQMRIVVSVDPADFRAGIDGLCRICQSELRADPFSGWVFVFRNRRGTSVKILAYDGQGFWVCQKRLSTGHFRYWPTRGESGQSELLAHQLQVLLMGGDPTTTRAAMPFRPVTPTFFAPMEQRD